MGICCSSRTPFSLESHFDVQSYIGKGSHSKVVRAKRKATGELVAIKMISISKADEWHSWDTEVMMMKEMEPHPNLIQLKDTFETVTYVANNHRHIDVNMHHIVGMNILLLLLLLMLLLYI
jgi:serine/threonine protein kinase